MLQPRRRSKLLANSEQRAVLARWTLHPHLLDESWRHNGARSLRTPSSLVYSQPRGGSSEPRDPRHWPRLLSDHRTGCRSARTVERSERRDDRHVFAGSKTKTSPGWSKRQPLTTRPTKVTTHGSAMKLSSGRAHRQPRVPRAARTTLPITDARRGHEIAPRFLTIEMASFTVADQERLSGA